MALGEPLPEVVDSPGSFPQGSPHSESLPWGPGFREDPEESGGLLFRAPPEWHVPERAERADLFARELRAPC